MLYLFHHFADRRNIFADRERSAAPSLINTVIQVFSLVQQTNAGQGRLILEVSRSNKVTQDCR